MLINYNKLTSIIIELKITPNQLWFLLGMVFDRKALFEYIHSCLAVSGRAFTTDEIDNLFDKGLIINTNPPAVQGEADYNSENITVTDKFKDLVGITTDAVNMAQEAYEAYPYSMKMDDKTIPTKGMSLEAFEVVYNKVVKGDKKLHEQIVEAILYAKTKNLVYICRRIDRFIEEKQYIPIIEMIANGDENSTETFA